MQFSRTIMQLIRTLFRFCHLHWEKDCRNLTRKLVVGKKWIFVDKKNATTAKYHVKPRYHLENIHQCKKDFALSSILVIYSSYCTGRTRPQQGRKAGLGSRLWKIPNLNVWIKNFPDHTISLGTVFWMVFLASARWRACHILVPLPVEDIEAVSRSDYKPFVQNSQSCPPSPALGIQCLTVPRIFKKLAAYLACLTVIVLQWLPTGAGVAGVVQWGSNPAPVGSHCSTTTVRQPPRG